MSDRKENLTIIMQGFSWKPGKKKKTGGKKGKILARRAISFFWGGEDGTIYSSQREMKGTPKWGMKGCTPRGERVGRNV